MKKLLTVLGSVAMVATTGAVAVACKTEVKQEDVVKKLEKNLEKAFDKFVEKCGEILKEIGSKSFTAEEIKQLEAKIEAEVAKLKTKVEGNVNDSELLDKIFANNKDKGQKEDNKNFPEAKGWKDIKDDFEQDWSNEKVEAKIKEILSKKDLTEEEKEAIVESIKQNVELIKAESEAKADLEAELLVDETLQGNSALLEKFKDAWTKYEAAKKEYKQDVEKALAEYNKEIVKVKDLK
ncbi:lipoprotein [Mycoplasma yeatsii]|uniref:lipoprotein n=1 Tax=Mycoplasma yeatsii TaxID=51365 RepID=UPI0005B25121|nr:lipoprotein [Mycoplasma yeatsii]AJM71671.1 lipoprotein [Mycoplasma yeatsii GM274B]